MFNTYVTFQPPKKKGKKKVAPAPLKIKKAVEPKKVVNPLFEKRPKNFGIGKERIPLNNYKAESTVTQW